MNSSVAEKLMQLSPQGVSDVPNKGEWVCGRVAKVTDGDTICVIVLLGDCPLRLSVRINGIDCPESVKGRAKNEAEVAAGKRVTEYVRGIMGDIVAVRLTAKDKYCRYLGDVKIEGIGSLSSHLLEKGYCKVYDGGKKQDWTAEELSKIMG